MDGSRRRPAAAARAPVGLADSPHHRRGAAVDAIVSRIGARLPIVAGLLIAAAGFGLYASIGSESAYSVSAASLAVVGVGAGLALAPPSTPSWPLSPRSAPAPARHC